ncbi:hypothetical protein N7533_003474 [Penicillium manginii]|uniref:uncharacterized protein n=1 Tax=Penicillium manginii TaxID=203109 RepID=UPI0025499402|nr:uncharacterized protein N7533_003474 [Penicillium manginii]KAJ5761435.1 hypothetical protein N7533_003474 [Penicillium manginii]
MKRPGSARRASSVRAPGNRRADVAMKMGVPTPTPTERIEPRGLVGDGGNWRGSSVVVARGGGHPGRLDVIEAACGGFGVRMPRWLVITEGGGC